MNNLGFYHLTNFLEKTAELKKLANHMQFRIQDIFITAPLSQMHMPMWI